MDSLQKLALLLMFVGIVGSYRHQCHCKHNNDASAFLKLSENQRMEKLFIESLKDLRQPTMEEWVRSRPGTEY